MSVKGSRLRRFLYEKSEILKGLNPPKCFIYNKHLGGFRRLGRNYDFYEKMDARMLPKRMEIGPKSKLWMKNNKLLSTIILTVSINYLTVSVNKNYRFG